MPCANCRKDLQSLGEGDVEPLDEFVLLKPESGNDVHDVGMEKTRIPISESIAIVFEASLKLYKKQISATCRLKMCPDCLTSLSDLHGSYLRFMGLAQEGSYMQQLIERSVLWRSFGERGFSFQCDDDFTPLVEVKLEEVGDREGVPAVTIKEEKEDPDFVAEGGDDDYADDDFPFLRRSKRRATVIKSRKSQGSRRKSSIPVVSSKSLTPAVSNRKVTCRPTKREPRDRIRQPKGVIKAKVEGRDKPFKCTEADCTKSYNCPKLLRRHIKFRHGGAAPEELLAVTCTQCLKPKIFLTPSQLRNHQKEVHATETPFECPKCERRFPTKNRLRIHTLLKHGQKKGSQTQTEKEPLLCPHNCPTPFRSRVSLKLHLKAVHNEVDTFPCSACGKIFHRNARYQRHLKYKHGVGLTPSDLEGRTCPICSKVFETKSQLKGHSESVHGTEKPYECDFEGCGKKFPSKNYLNIHRHMRHTREPVRYPCDQCGKSYTTKPSLQEHIDITHLGQKNIICEICGKAFARPNILVRHMETHDTTRERRYECTVCKQLFISERTLKSHAITHTSVKEHVCSHCGQAFLHYGSLRRHLHAKHGVNLATRGADAKEGHTCDQCGKTFKLREYLSQHLRSRTHGGKGHTAQRKRSAEEPNREGEDSDENPQDLVMGRGKGTGTMTTGKKSRSGQGRFELTAPPQGNLFWPQGTSIIPPGSSQYFNPST